MGRTPRCDGPGVWHHVMNRGIARRTAFETGRDVRFFLSRLARAAREGWIEIHAYCVMTTHFHLLVRSPEKGLSLAMCRILNDYVRWFNRSRRRDGPLFRGRFRSYPVDSLRYRRQVVRYIDSNPGDARITTSDGAYPHGSAYHYRRQSGPPWLERGWIEEAACSFSRRDKFDVRAYDECFGSPVDAGMVRVIEKRVELGLPNTDPVDDLLGAAPPRVLTWMRRKALLADGSSIGTPLCDIEDTLSLLAHLLAKYPDWRIGKGRTKRSAPELLTVALLRDLCGATWAEIALRTNTSEQGAMRTYRKHARALEDHPDYADIAAREYAKTLDRCYST